MDGSRPVLGDVRCPFDTVESRARTFLPHPCEVLRLTKCSLVAVQAPPHDPREELAGNFTQCARALFQNPTHVARGVTTIHCHTLQNLAGDSKLA
jgi:hypothetical protein